MLLAVYAMIRKEFRQMLRDRSILRLIFLMPLVQLFVLSYAVSTDVKLIKTIVYDFDRSSSSRQYQRNLSAGNYFVITTAKNALTDVEKNFRAFRCEAALVIPNGFERDLKQGRPCTIGFLLDGTNANSAAVALGYANMLTARFNETLSSHGYNFLLRQRKLYNPEAESVYFVVPGIVAILLTMITLMLTAMAIVRERETGTFEQLLVTPISPAALILGKTLPFAIVGFVEMSLALLVGISWFKIPFAGSWALLYALSGLFLLTTLGGGMLVSTISSTQQQAMFFSWFFAIFALLTSGFFTPVANMPKLLQYLTYANPLRFYLAAVRAIIMKGASIDVLYPEMIAMAVLGGIAFTLAWLRLIRKYQ